MEKTAKYVVFRHKESGHFLVDYKNQGSWAYEAHCDKNIQRALSISIEAFEEQRKHMKLLAKALDCEIIVVEANYDLKYLNGEDAKEVEVKVNGKSIVDMLHELEKEMGL